MINKDTIQALRRAIEKCGGRGGKPGPCPGPKKPPKSPTKPQGPNGSYSRQQLQAHNRRPVKPSKPPKDSSSKPAAKPQAQQTADSLKKELKKKEEAITKARKEVLTLAKKLGFKPTSKDAFVNEQQALEWSQIRAAKNLVLKDVTADVKPKLLAEASQSYSPSSSGNPKPRTGKKPPKQNKLPATEPGKKKPPEDKLPPKKPGNRPITDPRTGKTTVAKKSKLDAPVVEAKSILELTKSPETRKVAVEHPTIARLAGRKFADVVKAVAGMKPSEVWPNRQQAAKNLVKKFKEEFTDENAEKVIDTAVAHVKKVFTKEGAAARIISHFLKEQPW